MSTRNLSRRDILSTGLAAMVGGSLVSGSAVAAGEARPNILWLVSEDNSPFIGAYGDKLAHTPTIDGLARRGLLYRHAYANAPVCAVSRFGVLTGVYAESCGPAHHMRASARVSGELKGYPQYLRRAGYYCTNNAKTDYNSDIDPQTVWNESSETAHWRNRPAGVPFMAVFNYDTTHESQINRPTEGRVKPADVGVPAFLPDTPDMRVNIASYYNRMELMDGELAARLAELEMDGLTERTIIFYYSDHGGVLPRSKRFCYDEGLHTPLIVVFPQRYAHLAPAAMGSEIDTPVGFVDLAPTVLSLAGIAPPAQMVGQPFLGRKIKPRSSYVFGARDRMDERYDFTRTVTDGRYRYIRNYMPNRPWGQYYSYAWLNTGYQDWERSYLAGTLAPPQARFFKPKPYEELYDVKADPEELTNLIEQPEQQARLETLRKVLDDHLLAINDNGFIPEGSPPEGYRNSRASGAYPLKEIMAIASAAARRDAGRLMTFREALAHSNEVIRYWGAQGLLLLGKKALPALPALQRSMNDDASLHVRVVAAEALSGLGEAEAAVEVLMDLLDQPFYPVRLQAINALTYVGPAARAALPAIERAIAEEVPENWMVRNASIYLRLVLQDKYDPAYPVFDEEWLEEWWRRLNAV